MPTIRAFIAHPAYDEYWQARAVQPWMKTVTLPVLLVGGWWDQEDMWGTQAEYAALAAQSARGAELDLMLGPWLHGQWTGPTTRHLGALDFGQATTEEFRRREWEFFEANLKPCATAGCSGGRGAQVESFETGSDVWRHYGAWPPQQAQRRELYLEAGTEGRGALSFDAPAKAAAEARAQYVSDPANPVPYRQRPVQATYADDSQWYTWLVEDQGFLEGRADVAKWETPALEHDLTVTGEVKADLFAATTGTDADWVVKLMDVYPADAAKGMAGYELMVAEEIFRGRYRTSFERPQAIKPGEIDEYAWSLHGVDHVFEKGHRLMVEVQSSWFPLYDRNPQRFVKNIMTAPAKAYKPATEMIYESAQHPSHLELPVMKDAE